MHRYTSRDDNFRFPAATVWPVGQADRQRPGLDAVPQWHQIDHNQPLIYPESESPDGISYVVSLKKVTPAFSMCGIVDQGSDKLSEK